MFLKAIQTITALLNTNGERCHSNISARNNSTDKASYNMLMLDLKLLFPRSSLFDEAEVDMMKTFKAVGTTHYKVEFFLWWQYSEVYVYVNRN